ncbi:PREDICTED: alanine--glyoxylate aminotransferase 2, mitochondrial isoform X4 [Myotis davidii]|uniref:alanine--glyoxylate aminotransferase 2, mitochondrial isoform X4 n=1 Tax=Myotis davidii TaxID=225400 RepID=UPI0007677254|nr:PREDICTED: alanine--glyoxylate aminotransferase 2, mitochondrial isoform X4 [Myotis davidii]
MTPAWRHLPRALRLETSSPRTPKTCPSLSLHALQPRPGGLQGAPLPRAGVLPGASAAPPGPHAVALRPQGKQIPGLLLWDRHRQCRPLPPVIFLMNSGSEANDLAMLMARAHSKNTDIISFRGAYHGGSPFTIGLSNVGQFKMTLPSGVGCQSTMCPDVFRGPWGGSHCRDSPVQTIRKCSCAPDCCQAKDQYIEQFKDTLSTCVGKSIAGFFAEPIQGVNGFVQYPKGFLKEAFQLVRERGGVCIADEVQTGFGRLGSHFWGFQTHGVLPDIVTMAKGIGNGFPMAAVVTTPEIAKSLAKCVLHFNTFGGNPMACAIGSAVLEVRASSHMDVTHVTKRQLQSHTHILITLSHYRIIGEEG